MCEETLIISASARAFFIQLKLARCLQEVLGQAFPWLVSNLPARWHNFYSQLRQQQGLKPYKNKGPVAQRPILVLTQG